VEEDGRTHVLLSDFSRKWKKDVAIWMFHLKEQLWTVPWEDSRVCEALDFWLEMTDKGIQPDL